MTVGEQALDELRTRLEQVLGAREAATLMDHLPRERAATEAGLQNLQTTVESLSETVDRLSESVDRRFEAVDRRFDEIEHRFTIVDIKFEELEKRLVIRIDALGDRLEQRILAGLSSVREDFATQMNIQTRISVFATISALITLAALTLGLS
jgi:hypothetical protein